MHRKCQSPGLSLDPDSGFRAAFFPPPNMPCNPLSTLLTVFSTAGFSVCVSTFASLRVRSASASCSSIRTCDDAAPCAKLQLMIHMQAHHQRYAAAKGSLARDAA
jgi:hypothetical protein